MPFPQAGTLRHGPRKVLVVEVALKSRRIPQDVLACVASTNPHKLLFACTHGSEACLAVMLKQLIVGEWRTAENLVLDVSAQSIDKVWDSIASQVAYGDMGSEKATVEERFAMDARLKALREELASVEARGRKERQFARRNALFDQTKGLKQRIAELEEDM